MHSQKINAHLYFLIFFLTFIGYSIILLLVFDMGMSEASRIFTIPVRLAIVLFLFVSIILNKKFLHFSSTLILFLFFSSFYLIRLFIDYNKGVIYFIPIAEVLLYFLSFAVIPFVGIVIQRINNRQLDLIFNGMWIGGIIFSIIAIFSYNRFIGQVGRLASGTVGEDVLNPLSLSYTSSMVIGVIIFYLMHHKVQLKRRVLLLSVIGLSVIPFFLGASRGSLFAIFIPLLIYFYYLKGTKKIFKTILSLTIILVCLIFLDSYLGSDLLARFMNTPHAVETGAASASRMTIWKDSLQQFLNNPIFGDSIKVNGYGAYPHNSAIETLQSLGIIGFIPFFILIVSAWKVCRIIFKFHKELCWVAAIFIQSFIQDMFSGSIWSSDWLWLSMALIFALNYTLISKRNFIKQRSFLKEAKFPLTKERTDKV